MEGLTLRETNLNDLRNKVRAMTSDAVALSKLFDEEATRLNRMRMVSHLRVLHSSILQQLHAAKDTENAARYGYNQASIITSLSRLAIGGISKMASQNNELLSAIGDQLLQKPDDKKLPFGMVLVCIGPKGVPDGAGVVPVSEIARESNRDEAEVTSQLVKQGCRLFSEEEFSTLVDKLIKDAQEGRLLLPIPPDKLPQLNIRSPIVLTARLQSACPCGLPLTKGSGVAAETARKSPILPSAAGD